MMMRRRRMSSHHYLLLYFYYSSLPYYSWPFFFVQGQAEGGLRRRAFGPPGPEFSDLPNHLTGNFHGEKWWYILDDLGQDSIAFHLQNMPCLQDFPWGFWLRTGSCSSWIDWVALSTGLARHRGDNWWFFRVVVWCPLNEQGHFSGGFNHFLLSPLLGTEPKSSRIRNGYISQGLKHKPLLFSCPAWLN